MDLGKSRSPRIIGKNKNMTFFGSFMLQMLHFKMTALKYRKTCGIYRNSLRVQIAWPLQVKMSLLKHIIYQSSSKTNNLEKSSMEPTQ